MITYGYLLDHVMGGVFGQAIGDAFGTPALLRPEDTQKKFGWINSFLTPPIEHPAHGGFCAGHITDDTEQAMSLAMVMIRDKKASVEGTAEAIVNWFNAVGGENSPYVGPSTKKAVMALKNGADPYNSGKTGDTNGSAMRVSVVGLLNACNAEKAGDDAAITCIPTHNTHSAVAATSAVAAAVAKAVCADSTIDAVIEAGISAAKKHMWDGEPWFASDVSRKISAAVAIAKDEYRSVKQRLMDLYDFIGGGFLASEAVPSAFGIFAMGGGDVMKTAELAVNMSGDADTIGAMAVAVAGAFSGFSKIPESAVKMIETVNPDWAFRTIACGLAELAWERLNE